MKTWLVLLAAPLFAAAPARLLIVTGQSDTQYHDWRATTPFLERVLLGTGRFEIRVTEEPRGLTREALAPYGAVLLNYNGPRWGPGPEAALEEFVRSGRGLVSFHGTTYGPLMGTILRPGGGWDLAEGWAAYPRMLGVAWEPKNIGHAVRHAFAVEVSDRGHPITRGLDPEFIVNDELYHRMTHAPEIRVLARAFDDPARGGTGEREPIAWVLPYGRGRSFHMTLGHDTNALYQPGVMALVARAAEWAATGEVTIPPRLDPGAPPDDAIRVLVVTGGHGYDTSFYEIFAGDRGIRWSHAASPEEAFRPGMEKRCDVLVLYDMRDDIGEAARGHLRAFVEAGKGVVALHHAIVDYTAWPWWYQEVIGGKYFEKAEPGHPASKYKHDVPLVVRPTPAGAKHPIVRGLGELVTLDECYSGMWHAPRITVLMETDSPCNDKPVVYLGPRPDLRAVYIQLGHDSFTHRHPGYRRLVRNAISWAAGRAR